MTINQTFYSSSNGDRWQLVWNDVSKSVVVHHEPNLPSGGNSTDVPVPEFLDRSGATPQGEALKVLLEKRGK